MCEDDAAIWGTQTLNTFDAYTVIYSYSSYIAITDIRYRTEVNYVAVMDAVADHGIAVGNKCEVARNRGIDT